MAALPVPVEGSAGRKAENLHEIVTRQKWAVLLKQIGPDLVLSTDDLEVRIRSA